MNQLKKVLTSADAKYIVENTGEIKTLLEANLSHPLYKNYKAILTPERLKVLEMFSKGVGFEFCDYGNWEWASGYQREVSVKFLTRHRVRPISQIRIELKPTKAALNRAKELREYVHKYGANKMSTVEWDIEALEGSTYKWINPQEYLRMIKTHKSKILSVLGAWEVIHE